MISVAQTKRVLRKLGELGLITKRSSHGRGVASEYVLHTEKGVAGAPFSRETPAEEKEVAHDPFSEKGVTDAQKRGHLGQEKGSPMTPLSGSNQENNRESVITRSTPPEDFSPSDMTRRRIRGYYPEVDMDLLLAHFCAITFKTPKSWDARFLQHGLEHGRKFSRAPPDNRDRPTVPASESQHPALVAERERQRQSQNTT